MTAKRFSVECDDADIWEYNHFLAVAYDHHNALKFAERLNKLSEENEQLRRVKGKLEIEIEVLSDELAQCKAVIDKRWNEYLEKKGDDVND